MSKKINAMYFSATGTTKKVVCKIADIISKNFKEENQIHNIDFTLPKIRKDSVSFSDKDVVIIGVPVYAGRVPNVLLQYLNSVKGNGALAVPVVVYGNRNYDDALMELKDILESKDFRIIAGCAFIGEHSFSTILGKKRPDEKDMALIDNFATQIYKKMINSNKFKAIDIKGNNPYRNYYVPKNPHNEPVDIRKVTPKTNEDCIDCKLCVNVCPMGSINIVDVSILNGICIKCGACIKKCPTHAKYYDDENYLRHKHELEVDFTFRREPELFI